MAVTSRGTSSLPLASSSAVQTPLAPLPTPVRKCHKPSIGPSVELEVKLEPGISGVPSSSVVLAVVASTYVMAAGAAEISAPSRTTANNNLIRPALVVTRARWGTTLGRIAYPLLEG